MKITVTGSLGNSSKPLTQALVQQGHEVLVISSNPGKQKDIEALGATAAIGRLEDVTFLTAALSGAGAVYAMVPADFSVPDILAYYETIGNSYAEAIKRSGVKHVVHLSSWGAHLARGTGIIVGSHRVELMLNGLKDTAVTHLRPCSFYNNLLHYTAMIKGTGFIGTNYGDEDKLAMVSPRDIAVAAAEELVLQHTGIKVRYVVSDERTCSEIAKVLGTAIGVPELKWITLTDAAVKEQMEKNGVPAHIARNLVELNASIHSGLIREDYDRHRPAEPGKVKLEDFAMEFAAAFNK